jgi:hypothetical protein
VEEGVEVGFWTRVLWAVWQPTSSREAELAHENRLLRVEIDSLRLANEELGLLNENLRRWLMANTAAARTAAEMMGAPRQ